MKRFRLLFRLTFLVLLAAAGCRQDNDDPATPLPQPTNTTVPEVEETPLPAADGDLSFITVAIDAPSRFGDFGDIDEFGTVIGFDADVMADLAASAGFEYEFVVTSFSGLLNSVSNHEFDVAMSAIVIPDEPPPGIAFTIPYLEVGQVLVVRANERVLQSYQDIGSNTPIGVQSFSSGEEAALETVGLVEPSLYTYSSTPAALQALIDGAVEGVIIDHDDANHFVNSYPQQLKIVGGSSREAWITHKGYGIAVSAENQPLLNMLNEAIAQSGNDGTIDRLTRAWLISNETIEAGESLVGTPANELVIGIAGQLENIDPAGREPDLVSWEILYNTMSGLLMYDAENRLVPIVAADFPLISEDKLEYTFSLRPDLAFPDNSPLTAADVKFSINRAAQLGNFLVNSYLKDANEDNFADADAVQVVDDLTVRIILQEPTAYFSSVLASPPFFIVSQDCYTNNLDPVLTCGGIGPYQITEWNIDQQMRLKTNPQWPGPAPAFENIQLRFYDDPAAMRRSLENNAIDIAWTGLFRRDQLELRDSPGYIVWQGPATFKSYLVFEQSSELWDNARLRQAIAYAIDRQALADNVFDGTRQPLYSPVPGDIPGHLDTEPPRDLAISQAILQASGYTTANPLEMTIWYVDDGRYTVLEEEYAQALAAQLEETDLIAVTLQGAPWDVFRPQSLTCNYPAFLLGWPSSGQPASYLDAMSWMEYFLTNTDRICSNYESPAMDALLEAALAETDEAARMELYAQIQTLWAEEYPTLDLTQEPRVAVSRSTVRNVTINAMGLMHYALLVKGPE